jgi:hypothetical protein
MSSAQEPLRDWKADPRAKMGGLAPPRFLDGGSVTVGRMIGPGAMLKMWMEPLLLPTHSCTSPSALTLKAMPRMKLLCACRLLPESANPELAVPGGAAAGSLHTYSKLVPLSSQTFILEHFGAFWRVVDACALQQPSRRDHVQNDGSPYKMPALPLVMSALLARASIFS